MDENTKKPIVGKPATLSPPRKLGEPGMELWNTVQREYAITDCGGTELLMQACLAADRAAALAAVIDQDGERIHTKSGIRSHPCLRDELAARSFIVRTLQRLGITDEIVQPIGRPPRPFGWKGPHAD